MLCTLVISIPFVLACMLLCCFIEPETDSKPKHAPQGQPAKAPTKVARAEKLD